MKKIKNRYLRWWSTAPLWAKILYSALVITTLIQVGTELLEGKYVAALVVSAIPLTLIAILPVQNDDD